MTNFKQQCSVTPKPTNWDARNQYQTGVVRGGSHEAAAAVVSVSRRCRTLVATFIRGAFAPIDMCVFRERKNRLPENTRSLEESVQRHLFNTTVTYNLI